MQEILRNNTGKTLHSSVQQSLGFAPKTNFIGALQDFNKRAPEDVSSAFRFRCPSSACLFAEAGSIQDWEDDRKGATVAAISHALGVDKGLVSLALNAG
jgi:hypothetical protein